MYRKQLLALAGIAGVGGLVLSTSASDATVVNFAWGSGSTITGVGTTNQAVPGADGVSGVTAGTWSFSATAGGGTGFADSGSLDVASSTGGTLDVFVTFSGITQPLSATQAYLASYTLNSVSGGTAAVTLNTYLDQNNLAQPTVASLSTDQLLSTATLSTLITDVISGSANTGNGPYSITEEYIITTLTGTTTSATIDLTATPLPGALSLFGGGLGVLGLLARRKKRKGVTAVSAIA
jgi:hypothetical protein